MPPEISRSTRLTTPECCSILRYTYSMSVGEKSILRPSAHYLKPFYSLFGCEGIPQGCFTRCDWYMFFFSPFFAELIFSCTSSVVPVSWTLTGCSRPSFLFALTVAMRCGVTTVVSRSDGTMHNFHFQSENLVTKCLLHLHTPWSSSSESAGKAADFKIIPRSSEHRM